MNSDVVSVDSASEATRETVDRALASFGAGDFDDYAVMESVTTTTVV